MTLPATATAGAPGTRDLSFGERGTLEPNLPGTIGDTPEVQTDSQGDIYLAGTVSDVNGDPAIVVGRYSADGRPDPAFGSDGLTVLQFGEGPDRATYASALAVQPDGGMVVVGSASTADRSSGLSAVRVDRTGRVLWAAVHRIGVGAVSVARQPDGKLVIGGQTDLAGSGNTPEPALVRVDGADGSLDTSFANTGVIVDPVARVRPSNDIAFARIESVAVTPSGVVIAAGGRTGGCGTRPVAQHFLRGPASAGAPRESRSCARRRSVPMRAPGR